MPRPEEPEELTVRETFSRLTVDDLKALLALARGPVQARKAELDDWFRSSSPVSGQMVTGVAG